MATRAEIVFEKKRGRGEYGRISVGWDGYPEGVGRVLAELLVEREPSVRSASDLRGLMEDAVERIRSSMLHPARDSVYIIDDDSYRHMLLDYIYYVGYQRRRLWIECEGQRFGTERAAAPAREFLEMFPASSGAS